ncbi:hypothetical protein GUITHDRAFT_103749 [Guillardia theta CCMP2712]|uniref:SAM domain-containing protein n=1 Tax=Guillardia theta (strain CCMP2712) TaxID=905079 RepID=L1JPX8_GUITC|nr:hypothetical protein GUITHDRAFT_103749 [Guillardia theta CCMP2712]EKX50517.1 hypothetical protein GUITHDRAFT_103749 [Guillardia theta CCMP2712]|eukprot:XP_005837497.1 hypothetical protein GUITHDRAFT_103749 [Guillardia theta CCMP2712]
MYALAYSSILKSRKNPSEVSTSNRKEKVEAKVIKQEKVVEEAAVEEEEDEERVSDAACVFLKERSDYRLVRMVLEEAGLERAHASVFVREKIDDRAIVLLTRDDMLDRLQLPFADVFRIFSALEALERKNRPSNK